MIDTSRQWQATLWTGEENKEGMIFYGDTLLSLRKSARDWLAENRPSFFQSATVTCFYSDGTQSDELMSRRNIEDGWYLRNRTGPRVFGSSPRSFESVLDEFIEKGIYPEKGPDHSDRPPIIDGKLQLHYIKTIRREPDEMKANELLKRGWYIISIDHREEPDSRSVYSVYVLGHPEEDAI